MSAKYSFGVPSESVGKLPMNMGNCQGLECRNNVQKPCWLRPWFQGSRLHFQVGFANEILVSLCSYGKYRNRCSCRDPAYSGTADNGTDSPSAYRVPSRLDTSWQGLFSSPWGVTVWGSDPRQRWCCLRMCCNPGDVSLLPSLYPLQGILAHPSAKKGTY